MTLRTSYWQLSVKTLYWLIIKETSGNTNAVKRRDLVGRQEVVDWILRYRSETTREFMGFTMSRVGWEAKLKEWGIEA